MDTFIHTLRTTTLPQALNYASFLGRTIAHSPYTQPIAALALGLGIGFFIGRTFFPRIIITRTVTRALPPPPAVPAEVVDEAAPPSRTLELLHAALEQLRSASSALQQADDTRAHQAREIARLKAALEVYRQAEAAQMRPSATSPQ